MSNSSRVASLPSSIKSPVKDRKGIYKAYLLPMNSFYYGTEISTPPPSPPHIGKNTKSNGTVPVPIAIKSGLRLRIHFIRIQHFRLNTDPDPDPIQIRTQYGSGPNTDPDPIRIRIQSGSRALMTKKFKKNYSWKKFNFFFINTTIYLSLGLL